MAWWRGGVVVVTALDRFGRSLSGVIRGGGADRGRGAAALVAGGDRLLDAHRADARRDLRLAGGLRAGAADFTEAGDDADRVLTVCEDVIVSHEVDGDLAVFDREAATFAAAVGSALADLERSLPAARVLRVEAVPVAGELFVAAVS